MVKGEKRLLNGKKIDLSTKSDVANSCKLETKKLRLRLHAFFPDVTDMKHIDSSY